MISFTVDMSQQCTPLRVIFVVTGWKLVFEFISSRTVQNNIYFWFFITCRPGKFYTLKCNWLERHVFQPFVLIALMYSTLWVLVCDIVDCSNVTAVYTVEGHPMFLGFLAVGLHFKHGYHLLDP